MIQKPALSAASEKPGFLFKLEPASAWIAILGLFGLTTLAAIAGAGTVLRVLFPAASLGVAIFLYFRAPILYNGFNWWIWFLTPLLRRIADYNSSYDPLSLMLTAPYFVTLVSLFTFHKNLPKARQQGNIPFVLAAVAVIYSFLIGLVSNSPITVARALLDWLPPVLFGLHLATNWQSYPEISQNTQRVFVWGTLVTGSYGIYQYMVAPMWDRFWLENVGLVSFGLPEPQGIRVWSTMNGPAPFASVTLAGLMLLFSYKEQLRVPAAIAGYLAFMLSLVRAAWGAWFIGLLVLMSSLKSHLQMRLIATIIVMSLCILPLTAIEPFSEVINSRVETLTNVQDDSSFNARTDTYQTSLGIALSQIPGKGLGGTWVIASGGNAERVALDSGVLDVFFTLGWFGALPYLSGMILLLFSQFQGSEASSDLFAGAARAITLSLFVGLILAPFMTGLSGLVLWGFLGIGVAARKYHIYQQRLRISTYRSETTS